MVVFTLLREEFVVPVLLATRIFENFRCSTDNAWHVIITVCTFVRYICYNHLILMGKKMQSIGIQRFACWLFVKTERGLAGGAIRYHLISFSQFLDFQFQLKRSHGQLGSKQSRMTTLWLHYCRSYLCMRYYSHHIHKICSMYIDLLNKHLLFIIFKWI